MPTRVRMGRCPSDRDSRTERGNRPGLPARRCASEVHQGFKAWILPGGGGWTGGVGVLRGRRYGKRRSGGGGPRVSKAVQQAAAPSAPPPRSGLRAREDPRTPSPGIPGRRGRVIERHDESRSRHGGAGPPLHGSLRGTRAPAQNCTRVRPSAEGHFAAYAALSFRAQSCPRRPPRASETRHCTCELVYSLSCPTRSPTRLATARTRAQRGPCCPRTGWDPGHRQGPARS